jgi:hypothetical protein
MNTSWIGNMPRTKFRCPLCGHLYQPWRQAQGLIKAQKVLVTQAPRDQAVHSHAGVLKPGETLVYLVEWADTATTALQNRFKEIAARVAEGITHPDRFGTTLDQLHLLVKKHGQRSYFRELPFTETIKAHIDHINETCYNARGGTKAEDFDDEEDYAARPPPGKLWEYLHLQPTFHGMQLTVVGDDYAVMKSDDVIRMWMLSRYMIDETSRL